MSDLLISIKLFHILTGLITASVLCLAAIQAILLSVQNKFLRYRFATKMMVTAPPLQSMETLLFQMIGCGFILLTLVLLSSLFCFKNAFAQDMLDHSLLAILSWIVFVILLLGRKLFGWRGKKAVYWTLAGVTLSFLPLLFGYL